MEIEKVCIVNADAPSIAEAEFCEEYPSLWHAPVLKRGQKIIIKGITYKPEQPVRKNRGRF